ncbi:hypothetical protein 65p148 [Aeromonas phage 65]|uniref:Uncharacterized protein n=2 Tax=Ishigurovirus osborne TaxID=260149 RepID=E5DRY2_9CAUD|nr:hypothetical protein ST65p148 [Aeromonas phage 65]ADQ53156.1 hypothetical protein 65p148 [Aeromonas phage 65]
MSKLPEFVSFNKSVKIDDMTLMLPVNTHKFDKFAVTINDNGLVELWPESCVDVGISYNENIGFHVSANPDHYSWDSEIMVGHMYEDDPASATYLNCMWQFKREGSSIKFISKECFTSYSGRVK